MAVSLKHQFVSAVADGADTSLVRPSNWNAEHALTMATGRLLGRTTASAGDVEEISAGTGITLSSGSISVTTNTYQPLDADLTAIAALAGTSGFLKKTAADTWSLDTSTYITSNQTITLSGDVSGSGSTAITASIGSNKVTNAMLAQVATATIKGRTTASTGNVEDLSASQARTVLGLATTDSPQFTAIELGNASDTTLTRSSAGVLAVEGVTVSLNSTSATHTASTIELGNATDTTLSRSAAGVLAVEGVVVPTISSTNTLTNKRVTPRVTSTTSTTSPWAWNSDDADTFAFTALANDLTINADAGTPTDGQKVLFRFKPNTTGIDLTWTTGASKAFRAIGITLPTALTNGKTTYVGCVYNSADSRWDAIATGSEA